MRNGFHKHLSDCAIHVADNMKVLIGVDVINGHITEGTARYNEKWEFIAQVEWNGKTYTAVRRGEQFKRYWQIESN